MYIRWLNIAETVLLSVVQKAVMAEIAKWTSSPRFLAAKQSGEGRQGYWTSCGSRLYSGGVDVLRGWAVRVDFPIAKYANTHRWNLMIKDLVKQFLP